MYCFRLFKSHTFLVFTIHHGLYLHAIHRLLRCTNRYNNCETTLTTLELSRGWTVGPNLHGVQVPSSSFKKSTPIGFHSLSSRGRQYLGVESDFWGHVKAVTGKSELLYSRTRIASSANRGLEQATSSVVYKTVFLSRIIYASEIWSKGTLIIRGEPSYRSQGHTKPHRPMRGMQLS